MRPFSKASIRDVLQGHLQAAMAEIDRLEADYALRASPTELLSHYSDKARVEPLVLDVEGKYIEDQRGTRIDISRDFNRMTVPWVKPEVQGTRVTLAIPYTGDANLWQCQPSTRTQSGYPDIEVLDDRITLRFEFPDDSADSKRLGQEIGSAVEALARAVTTLHSDVTVHNASVEAQVRQALDKKTAKARAATGAIAGLDIPIKRRDERPSYAVPVKRRPSPVSRPKVATEPFKPEPMLPEVEYEYILGVLGSMALVIERNPRSFGSLDEEAIRDHFLIQLNGHYEGGASGETFNAGGKSDILIRHEDRNVFIAECKFWRGPTSADEAISQLLRYLSWRDCKCAILVFNRTRDSTAVRAKLHAVVEERPEHRRTIANDIAGRSRYVLVKPDDPGKEILLTTLLFDVPGPIEAT